MLDWDSGLILNSILYTTEQEMETKCFQRGGMFALKGGLE